MIDRYRAIEKILEHVQASDLVVSTTGMISRELFALNDRPENFYMIGSMGLASALGLGLAIQAPQKRVFILEGDGSALMSLGTLPLIASEAVPTWSTSSWTTRPTSPPAANRQSVPSSTWPRPPPAPVIPGHAGSKKLRNWGWP
ncbi:MAG: hypothetical protein IIB32_01130 [Chloroflexi bacterium]|nr:hypothetical protein [Chloroflexota bacterium]